MHVIFEYMNYLLLQKISLRNIKYQFVKNTLQNYERFLGFHLNPNNFSFHNLKPSSGEFSETRLTLSSARIMYPGSGNSCHEKCQVKS